KPEEDIRFTMRSSQYGTVSHSHGDQNSFVIEAFGEPLAIPSGLYALYSSVHHHGWTRQTRAHNAVTFDGAGQIVRSPEAVGAITAFHTDERLTYTLGDASAAYGDRIKRCTREVFCLDRKFFVLVDRFEPTYESMWTWHLHAARPMVVDAQNRRALVQYEKACMDVVFCHSLELRFRAWDGFDLMPFGYDSSEDLPENIARYHLDVFSAMPLERDALVTVLSPRRVTDPAAQITPLLDGQGEGARIEDGGCVYRVVIGKDGAAIDVDGIRCDGNAAVLFETADGILERAAVVGGQMLVVNGKEVDPSLMIFLEN
ncbi:MAG: heparinase II/III family protein, partial [bacterium]|nr:heparinase II/III family protein [bacterium]